MAIYDKYLEDLERRIDPEVEETLTALWKSFLDGEIKTGTFNPERPVKSPATLEWPAVRINESLDDYDKMAIQQYKMASDCLAQGSGQMMGVRCNYGSSILPSIFGPELFIMDDEFNTLPTSKPLEGGKDTIRKLIAQGIPDLHAGWGEKTFEMGRRFIEIGEKYPKVCEYISIYHPDLQGPMDVVEVLWGSELFIDIMDEPQLVKDFLSLVTEAYIAFMKEWNKLVPPYKINGCSVHWSFMQPGTIMLRDDSAMNFSPEVFEEFILPYNQRLLNEFDGGCMHFCGRGEHFVPVAVKMDKLYAINMSQPQYNNMESIYRNTVDRGVFIIGLSGSAVEEAAAKGRDLRGRVYSPQ